MLCFCLQILFYNIIVSSTKIGIPGCALKKKQRKIKYLHGPLF